MTIYKVSCFSHKNCLNIGDEVRVIGKKGLAGEVKADKIITIKQTPQPDCECKDPDFDPKIITTKFDETGIVRYIKTGDNEFHFKMETK